MNYKLIFFYFSMYYLVYLTVEAWTREAEEMGAHLGEGTLLELLLTH